MREPSAQPPRSQPRAPAAAEQTPPRTRPSRHSPRHHSITHEPSGTNVELERDVATAAASERAHLARGFASRARNHRARARARQPPPSSRRREPVPLDTRRAITRSYTSHPAPTSSLSETPQRPPPPSAHTLRADARAGRATIALAPARGVGQPHASHRRSVAAQTLPPRYDQAMTAQCAHSARQSTSRTRNPRARARARRRPAHSRPPPSSCFRKGTLLDTLRAITRSNTSCPARRDTVAAAAVERAHAVRPLASRTHKFASHEPFPCLVTEPTVGRPYRTQEPSSFRH